MAARRSVEGHPDPSHPDAPQSPQPSGAITGREGWLQYADVLLQRALMIHRAVRGHAADELAGDTGPGAAEAVARIDAQFAQPLRIAELALLESIYDGASWSSIIENSRLTVAEAGALALLAAIEDDIRRQKLVGFLNDDITQRRLTPHALRAIAVSDADVDALLRSMGPGGGLRRACLIGPPADAPWAAGEIRLHPQVMWWLHDDGAPSEQLPDGTRILAVPGQGDDDFVLASGPDRVRRLQAVVESLSGNGFLIVGPPEHADGWEAIVRYASLTGAAIVVETDGDLPAHAADRIAAATHLSWAVVGATEQPLRCLPSRPWRQARVGLPAATDEEVRGALGAPTDAAVVLSADQLQLVSSASAALDGDLAAAVRRLAAGGIDRLAERIVPTRGWDDLVLATRERDLLQEIVVRARHRRKVFGDWKFDTASSGVLALFSGPSGTGKALAAEVVAKQLGLDLFRIDLSRVVGKYIGETEKMLSEVFDAALTSPMVLFLDEADALVGKRSDVSDAHDRCADSELGYLLRRLEAHNGIVVFASNLACTIDQAFVRRIHVWVRFSPPQAAERLQIWHRSVPATAPRGEIDWDGLAEGLELSGSQIRNIAVRAAFLAAEAGTELGIEHLLEAARREMNKAGLTFPEGLLARLGR